jgi:hypothetical protein
MCQQSQREGPLSGKMWTKNEVGEERGIIGCSNIMKYCMRRRIFVKGGKN